MPTTLETLTSNPLQPKLWPEDAKTISMNKFSNNLDLAKGTVLGKVTADGKLAAYNNANANGTETAVGILGVDINTDANGNIYFADDSAVPSALNTPSKAGVPVFISGCFDTADLVGWDAPAAVDLGAKTLPNGFIRIP